MTQPAVSVLMPVRNEARFLPAALDSLCRQTFTDWELFAVDDGSTDETPAILAAAMAQDRRVRVLTIPGQGLVPALNEGLAADAFAARDDERMLVTVGTRGAREQIRRWARGKGLCEGQEYLCVT